MTMVCHRPEGLDQLEAITNFSKRELQVLYRGFKNVRDCGGFTKHQIYPHSDKPDQKPNLKCQYSRHQDPFLLLLILFISFTHSGNVFAERGSFRSFSFLSKHTKILGLKNTPNYNSEFWVSLLLKWTKVYFFYFCSQISLSLKCIKWRITPDLFLSLYSLCNKSLL